MVGLMLADAAIEMRYWTAAFTSPYWTGFLIDWTSAAHNYSVRLDQALFAQIQWRAISSVRVCCLPADCVFVRPERAIWCEMNHSHAEVNCCQRRGVNLPASLLSLRRQYSAPSLPQSICGASGVQSTIRSP